MFDREKVEYFQRSVGGQAFIYPLGDRLRLFVSSDGRNWTTELFASGEARESAIRQSLRPLEDGFLPGQVEALLANFATTLSESAPPPVEEAETGGVSPVENPVTELTPTEAAAETTPESERPRDDTDALKNLEALAEGANPTEMAAELAKESAAVTEEESAEQKATPSETENPDSQSDEMVTQDEPAETEEQPEPSGSPETVETEESSEEEEESVNPTEEEETTEKKKGGEE